MNSRPTALTAILSLALVGCGTDRSDAGPDIVARDVPPDLQASETSPNDANQPETAGPDVFAMDTSSDAADAGEDVLATDVVGGDATLPASCVPTLTAPDDGTASIDAYPRFFWSEPACDGHPDRRFQIDIATDIAFASIVKTDRVYSARYIDADGLAVGTYYWRVRGFDASGASAWSAARSVRVTRPAMSLTVAAGSTRAQTRR